MSAPTGLLPRSPVLISKNATALMEPCAWSGAIAKDQRGRLDEERIAGFNQSADLSTYRRKYSVRTTRATAHCIFNHIGSGGCNRLIGARAFWIIILKRDRWPASSGRMRIDR